MYYRDRPWHFRAGEDTAIRLRVPDASLESEHLAEFRWRTQPKGES